VALYSPGVALGETRYAVLGMMQSPPDQVSGFVSAIREMTEASECR
jgi:hypothetical protein